MVSLVGHILPVKRTLLFTRLITPRARPLLHTAAVTSIVFSRYGTQSGSTHSDTHTHNIRCSTSVIVPRPSGFCPSHGAPLAGLSPKVCFGVTKVLYPRHPSPHFSPPRNQLAQAARAWWHPQYPPQWREQYGRHGLRAWLDHAHGRRIAGFPPSPSACVSVTATCKKRAVAESSCHRLCVSHELICSRSSGGAASWSPARVIASRGEGRGALPRATDEQFVGVGQGVCALPSRKEAMRCGARCEPGGREAAGDGGARSVQGRARLQIRGRARGGAHVEHAVHVRDAGGVEAQRLVERRRALPRVERGAYDAGRGAAREAGGGGRPRCT